MHCTEGLSPLLRWGVALLALTLAGCASRPLPPAASSAPAVASQSPMAPPPSPPPPPRADSAKAEPVQPGNAAGATRAAASAVTAAPGAAPAKAPPRYVRLGPPKTPRSWDELRLQAAQRLVDAHPDTSFVGTPPSVLLAIPILEVELHADGSVRHIRVMRVPGQAQDTTQLAIAAVQRAAPFGDVSRLPKPWKFVETFLFDDERRFMPRTLDR